MVTPSRVRPKTWDKIKPLIEAEADTWHFLDDTPKDLIVGFVIGALDRIKGDSDVAEVLAVDLLLGVEHGT